MIVSLPRTSFRIRFPWVRGGELVNQLKYLVDEADGDGLGKWSTAIAADGEDMLLAPRTNRCKSLMIHLSLRLLQSSLNEPQSAYTVSHLKVLKILLSPAETGVLGARNSTRSALAGDIILDLLNHDFYSRLGNAIKCIPVEAHSSSVVLPLLITLATAPFPIFEETSCTYKKCLLLLFKHILTIPLNRLPRASLIEFSSRLPLSSLEILSPSIPDIVASSSTPEYKFNLITNLYEFTQPSYQTLSLLTLDVYLHLLTELMGATSSSSFNLQETPFHLDPHIKERLAKISGIHHLASLLTKFPRNIWSQWSLASFLFTLATSCPTNRDNILSTLLEYPDRDLVGELYRGFVRTSPLGRDYNPDALMDAKFSSAWPPLLLLSDLYTRSVLAMGDGELFSIESDATTASRNQLKRIELIDFSKKLSNIAYALWSKEDQRIMEERVPGINLKWEVVREKVTTCLQAIHARDSRNPFMPPDHWLVSSQIDMNVFIEAAVSDEQSQATYVSPRLAVLNNIPFTIPVDVRKSIFKRFVANDMVRDKSGKTRVSLRKGSIAQDAFDKLEGVDIKAPFEITIIDEIGQEEASDGVSEVFFSTFFHEVFKRDRCFWLANEKQELYPSPHATEQHDLKWYRFTGRMVGKAIYEGHFVGVSFAGFFLNKWFGKQESFLDDLQSLDYDLWQGLVKLKRCTDPQDLSIYFSIDVEGKETHDLIPNGSNIAVTRENRLQYIQLVSRYRLSEQIKLQTEAFFQGLLDLIDSRFFRMFSQQDVTGLLGSASLPIDLVDLRRHTDYEGVYHDTEATVTAFWTVVDSFNQDERRLLLKFVTSCSRPPLLGFNDLVPNFTICDAGGDEQYLPTANKCHNLLKLPRYKTEHLLRNKLLLAIYAGCV